MSIRDELPGARSRRDAPQATQFHKSRVCEYRNGPCNNAANRYCQCISRAN